MGISRCHLLLEAEMLFDRSNVRAQRTELFCRRAGSQGFNDPSLSSQVRQVAQMCDPRQIRGNAQCGAPAAS
jgi:hypothetical protein